MHILCVTPNVAIDRTLVVPGFAIGGVWRATKVHVACGGKGVNVARAVAALGHRGTCAGMLGGRMGYLVAELAAAEGLDTAWTWMDHGDNRTCVIIVGGDGTASVINEPGCAISAATWDRFVGDVAAAAQGADVVCISGSLPPGTPAGGLSALVGGAGRPGCPVWVDVSGAALAEALSAPVAGVKVNADEAAALAGHPIVSAEDAAAAAEAIRRDGAPCVAVTLGAAGAVLVGDGSRLWARPPPIAAISAVGSGDCFLAGLVAGWPEGGSAEDALRLATAAGAANALRTTAGLTPADVARLRAETTLKPLL